MKKNFTLNSSLVVGIIVIFICSSFVSSIGGYYEDTDQFDIDISVNSEEQEDVVFTCSIFGLPGTPTHKRSIPLSDAEVFYEKIQDLQLEVARDPFSDNVLNLQREIITIAKEHTLLPNGVSTDEILSRLNPVKHANHPLLPRPRAPGRASETFCNYVSTGSGSALPIIILPRLIPILLTPIPRLFVRWSTYEGWTSCGGMRSGKGFIATGAQRGIALGFWGIGFSIFIPPVMAYGLFGYALYASVNAENISYWPPNYPPEITMISPSDGAENVPVSTSELSFHISDINKALMNYTVTTTPDVGSGSGSNKPDGTYSVPISGLEGSEKYTWHIQLDDGVHDVDVSYSFTTEPIAPIVSNPQPGDNANNVLLDLSQLSFHLSDPQGDLMDYIVETSPDIGSGSGYNVDEGTYTVNINGLDYSQEYKWYINGTDGENWKHKTYRFTTRPVSGPWWNSNWSYRKEIIVNYSMVEGELDNFPVLISLDSNTDLANHAQNDGDDIVFTDYNGLKLNHEFEKYDGSSGELIAWVNVPNLKSDTILYMYYGNLNCSNQQDPEKVWDSNFMMVQHLSETVGTHFDSTNYRNDGTPKGGLNQDAEGKVCGADKFDGIDDYIIIPDDPSLNFHDTNQFSISTWIKRDGSLVTGHESLVGKGYKGAGQGYIFQVDYNDKVRLTEWDKNGYGLIKSKTTIDTINWYHLVGIWDGITLYLYINGELDSSLYHGIENILDCDKPLEIGNKLGYSENQQPFHGTIDEVRISDIVRAPSWILTEYNNQNNPSSFLSVGPEETGP